MIVIYHDVGGAHSTAIAANIHINKLPNDKIPKKEEIINLPTFDKIEKSQYGHLIYIGQDEFGCSVYTLSRQFKPNLVIPAVENMYSILSGSTEGLFIVDTSKSVNTIMKIGGYSSRRLNLVAFGRPVVTYGCLRAYKNICNLVSSVKLQIQNSIKNDNL